MQPKEIKPESNQFHCSRCEEFTTAYEEDLKSKVLLSSKVKEYILERFPQQLCLACIIQLRKAYSISQLTV